MSAASDPIHERLQSLIEISQLLMSAVDPDEVPQVILDAAIRLFAVEGCSIALIDETARHVVFVAMAGPARVEPFRIVLGQGIAGWVAQTGEGVVCNDVDQDPRFFRGIDKQTGFTTRSILCAPLKRHDQLIGVIEAINTTRPQGFTTADLQLLTAFGGLAGTAISRSKMFSRVRNARAAFQEVLQAHYHLVVGTSTAMKEALRTARAAAATDTTVLLLGESGTGKEVVARAIHQWSPRAEHPFLAINCMALTPELLASELFGHEKGAFTGATSQKKGRFELADGGTIFLDEIGDLAPDLQAKLLRVLQDKEFQRVGGVKDIRADVRIVAATNRDLLQAMRQGRFRQDLFYRLNVVPITLPPLRDRRDDIPMLAEQFLERSCREMSREPLSISPAAMDMLQAYHWPGNVRELQNLIERAVVLAPGPVIRPQDFPAELRHTTSGRTGVEVYDGDIDPSVPLAEAVNAFKCARILQALERTGGNQSKAATLLGMPQSNLSRLMKTLGLR